MNGKYSVRFVPIKSNEVNKSFCYPDDNGDYMCIKTLSGAKSYYNINENRSLIKELFKKVLTKKGKWEWLIKAKKNEEKGEDIEVDKIFNMIKNHIKNESIFNTYLTDIEKYKCNNITYKKNPTVDIFGKKCDLNIVFININDDIDKNELKRLCREYDNTSIIRNFNNNEVSYILNASLIINKFGLSKYIKSDISHELRHAFTYMKIIENDVESSSIKKDNWDSIYKYCQKYLSSSEHKYGEEFYKIIYSIYSCDKEELDAFTQQAYTEVKDMKSDNHIKFHLKETDLWNVINNLKDVIDILNKDRYREKYIVLRKHIGTKNLPS